MLINQKPTYSDSKLYEAYAQIPSNEYVLLSALGRFCSETLPLSDKKVVLNAHITRSTLIIIDVLLAAGAEVTVTATSELVVHQNMLDVIQQAAEKNQKLHWCAENKVGSDLQFDIVIDCAASLLKKGVSPRGHAVELTQTDPKLYNAITYPVINVDSSKIKTIETFEGTGNALVRVLVEKVFKNDSKVNIDASEDEQRVPVKETPEVTEDGIKILENRLENKTFVVFGFGKVGRGIAMSLADFVSRENITIIEISKSALRHAHKKGFQVLKLEPSHSPQSNLDIKSLLTRTDCCITATGVEGCISQQFSQKDFPENLHKINMGTHDEWGKNFPEETILNEKKPANFMLEYPTLMRFLDPVFCGLIEAAFYPSNCLSAGLNDLPKRIEKKIFNNYVNAYLDGTPLDKIYEPFSTPPKESPAPSLASSPEMTSQEFGSLTGSGFWATGEKNRTSPNTLDSQNCLLHRTSSDPSLLGANLKKFDKYFKGNSFNLPSFQLASPEEKRKTTIKAM